jgi:hypothetical protein
MMKWCMRLGFEMSRVAVTGPFFFSIWPGAAFFFL